tara:strand:- start:273 stop:782 length:510 start_codon:yes stop_codon:yes gene_type:complete
MDGARLFNAMVKTNTKPNEYGSIFDSISVCMSKGLGAPIGSLLLGTHTFIAQAKRIRKVLGGGMRQAGYLAAACDFALDHHVDLLKEDHRRAKEIETVLAQVAFVGEVLPVETNIIIFSTDKPAGLVAYLKDKNILCSAISATQIRFVTHFQFNDSMLEKLKQALLSYS